MKLTSLKTVPEGGTTVSRWVDQVPEVDQNCVLILNRNQRLDKTKLEFMIKNGITGE